MAARTADARWEGSLKEGKGTMRLQDGAYEAPFTFGSRCEEGEGSNPEELVAAALAGCFSMKLSGDLGAAGHDPQTVETTAKALLRTDDTGPRIATIALTTRARVPGIDDAEFQRIAEESK